MESNANEKQLINVSTLSYLYNYQFKNTLHGIICVHNRVSTWDLKHFPPIKKVQDHHCLLLVKIISLPSKDGLPVERHRQL